MTLSTTDRTKLNNLSPNLAPNQVAASALRLAVFQEIYTYLDNIIADLNAYQGAGAVKSVNLADGSILSVKLADNAITGAKLLDGAVATLKLADGSVTTVKLGDKSVDAAKLADLSVGQSHHQDNGIPGRALPDNVILQRHMSDNSVGSAEIQAGAVQSQHLANGIVGATKLDPSLLQNYGDIAVNAEFDKRGVSVEKYGASITKTAIENATAIQATIDYVEGIGGGYVEFPAGTFLTNKLNLKSNVRLRGRGNATMLRFNDTTGPAINGVSVGSALQFFSLESLQVYTPNLAVNEVAIDLKNAYYYHLTDVQIAGANQLGTGIRVNANGVPGYYGMLLRTKISNFEKGALLETSANAHRFIGSWFYGCKDGIEISDANGNAIIGCTFQDFTRRGVYFNDTGAGKTHGNAVTHSYFEAIAATPADIVAGVHVNSTARTNSLFGNKYSNLVTQSKPEVLDEGIWTMRLEYSGSSYSEVMKLPTFTILPTFDEATKPAPVDAQLGSMVYAKETAGTRDKLRAILRETTGTRNWVNVLYEMNGTVNVDNVTLSSVGPISQFNLGNIRVGTKANTAEREMNWDSTAKTLRVHDGVANRNVITVSFASGVPTFNATFRGQEYIDTATLTAYKAVQTGTGATDWKPIT